jgi:ATP-binding cassette subfamily F protein 3
VHQERNERRRQRCLVALEEEIAGLEAKLRHLEEALQTASIAGDVPQVTALGVEIAELQETLEVRYDEWAAIADE